MRILVVLAAVVAAASGASWTYEEPEKWNEVAAVCDGQRQSPIDIDTFNVHYDEDINDLHFDNYDTPVDLHINNNGHSFTGFVTLNEGPGMPDMNAAHVKSKAFPDPVSDYQLWQFHFHWGEDDNSGSEHLISGRSYPLEAHFVHWNTKYGELGNAVNEADGLVVFGLFFEIGPHNDALEKMIDGIAGNVEYQSPDSYTLPDKWEPSSIFPTPNMERFFRYDGGLTVPGCMETVTWTVLETPAHVSHEQMMKIRAMLRYNSTVPNNKPIGFNFRPPQPLYDRKVRFSEPTTAPVDKDAFFYFTFFPGPLGPDNWDKVKVPDYSSNECDGKRQSPIDIIPEEAVCKNLEPLKFSDGFNFPVQTLVWNSLSSARYLFDTDLIISGAGLPGSFNMFTFHFHWGLTDTAGSLHTINGRPYAGELQFVALNTKYSEILVSRPDEFVVLSVFIEISPEDNDDYKPLFDALDGDAVLYTEDPQVLTGAVTPISLMPKNRNRFYRYFGSNALPGCQEVFFYLVFEDPVRISSRQMAKLRRLYNTYRGNSTLPPQLIGHNIRPTQPINDREVIFADTTDPSVNMCDYTAGAGTLGVSAIFVTVVAMFKMVFC